MKLTHHGHSCIELDAGGVRVLFDPGTFSSFDDVKGVDAIVVTHQHADHLDPDAIDSLRAENPDAVWFAEPQTAQLLADKGVEATATKAGETYDVAGVTPTASPGAIPRSVSSVATRALASSISP